MAIDTRRRQIEDVASSLFRDRGYPATSVRDIARALDIQGASLYAHVTSKEDVLWSIVTRAADRFESAADRALLTSVGERPADRLAAFVRAHVAVITDDPGLASVFVHEWRFLSPERRADVLARRDRYERRLRALIVRGIETGDFAAADPAIAATFLLTALNGLATWYRDDGRLSADSIGARFAELARRSLTDEATS